MNVVVDCGPSRVAITVPDDSAVLEYRDSPSSRDRAPVAQLVRGALAAPLGMEPFRALVGPGRRVTIAFDDPLRVPATVQAVFPALLDELAARGVAAEALTLISANGMHRKFALEEFRAYLGSGVVDAVGTERIVNHDCADAASLVDFGRSALGGPVRHHRALGESDLVIYVGNIAPNVWGGYGGNGAVVGLGSADSIAHHHARAVIGAAESCHGDAARMLYQRHKEAVAWQLEKASGRRVFYVECITDSGGVREVFAGHFDAVRRAAWPVADATFDAPAPPADILVVGLPERLLYGGTDNPLIALTALGFPCRMWKGAPVLREGGVVIGVTASQGMVDDTRYPSFEEVIHLYAGTGSVEALSRYEAAYLNRSHGDGFHPVHPFWLLYENEYLLRRARRIVFAGGRPSSLTRALGVETAPDFRSAWAMACEAVPAPRRTVVAPTYWTRPRIKFVVNP